MTLVSPNFLATSFGGRFVAFWRGFVTPTRFAFALTLIVFVATAVAACMLITPQVLAGPLGAYFPRSSKDATAFATREALQLAATPVTDPAPRLYVISDSILAHAFASDELTAQAMQEVTKQPWRVAFLTTPLQGPLDEAALAEYATKQKPGVVVLSLGYDRFGRTKEELVAQYRMGRIGLRSDWADAEVAALGERVRSRTGIYLIDNIHFLMRNATVVLTRALVGRPAKRRIDIYLLSPPLTATRLVKTRAAVLKELRRPEANDDVGTKILGDTVRRLRERGNVVVFVENPLSDNVYEGAKDRALYQKYLKRSRDMAISMGGVYCRLSDNFQPQAAAFPDYIHLDDPKSQAKLRSILANCVASASKGMSAK